MLAVTFLLPAVLWATTAAAAPVIIHLIMRTKPRRIVFPALRFVRKTHQANISMHIIKHIILLLMRMAAIALIAILIARAVIPAWQSTKADTTPVAAVFIIDNSGSMTAKSGGQTVLARGEDLAAKVVEALPSGSRMAVLETADPTAGGTFLAAREEVVKQIQRIPASYGHASVSSALTRAAGLLAKSDISPKEVYLVTDMTGQAWREGFSAKAEGIDFIVLDCGLAQDGNITLGPVKTAGAMVPVGVEVNVETTIYSTSFAGDVTVQTELDGQPVDQRTVRLSPGQPEMLEIPVRPQTEGIANGRIVLQQADSLEADNVRYFTLEVGPPPGMLIVCDSAGNETYFMMSNAVAPNRSGEPSRSWVKAETVTADRLSADMLARMRVVMLADVASLTDAQWQALGKYVNEGGNLWVVAGPAMSADSYNLPAAQKILPVAIKSMEELPKGVAFKAPQVAHAMIEPFMGPENPPLAEVLCKGRQAIQSSASDAQVVLRYADDVPAILTRPVGDGLTLFWNFSPAAQYFSRPGLPQFGVLAIRATRLLTSDPAVQTAYTWGQDVTIPLPKSFKSPIVTVREPAGGEAGKPAPAAETPISFDPRRGAVPLRADRLGHWQLKFTEDKRMVTRGFSVNMDTAESDLSRAEPANLEKMFPPGKLLVTADPSEVVRQRQTVTKPLDLGVPLLLALLALLTGEAYFANRFYKQPASPEE
ncbi:MAG: BatA and WFA domain-containing protein [Phycisphaerae bacterium]